MGFDRTANADLRKRSLVTARAILGQNGNRTRLVLAILLCCVASMFPMLLISWPLSVLLDWETLFYENEALVVLLYMGEALLRALFFFFLVLPLYLGVFRMAVRMTREETTELYDVFYYFSDKALYWRGIKVLCASLWSLIPLYIFYSFYGVFYQPEPVWTVAIAFMLLLPHLVISAFSGGFALLFAMQETASVGDCMRTARRLSKGEDGAISCFRFLSFGAWCFP